MNNKISNAPAPIRPLRGSTLSRKSAQRTEVHQVHLSSPPDWTNWTASQRVTHDDAAALTLNIEPPVQISTPQFEKFSKRREAFARAFSKTNIKLSEIAAFAVNESKWAGLPPELIAMAKSKPPAPRGTKDINPWDIHDERDPEPKNLWYTPARYFARQLVIQDTTLLTKRQKLAEKVSQSLTNAGIKKRGGELELAPTTVLKALVNVNLG